MKLVKVHSDDRRSIHVLQNLLKDKKEFSIIKLKKNKAIGGCMHNDKEYYIILEGKVMVRTNNSEIEGKMGDGGIFHKNTPHMFIGLEDSIICEFGITEDEKINSPKHIQMLEEVKRLNEK